MNFLSKLVEIATDNFGTLSEDEFLSDSSDEFSFGTTQRGFQINEDCVVTRVLTGSTPDLFGLEEGDEIVFIDGKEPTTSLILETCSGEPGTRVELVVVKEGSEDMHEITITWLPPPESQASVGIVIDLNLYVAKVVAESSAANGMVEVGDRVDSIDDTNVRGMDLHTVQLMLKGPPMSSVNLSLTKQNGNTLEVELKRRKDQSAGTLGLSLNNRCEVRMLVEGGAAAESGLISVGDSVLAVDGHALFPETISELFAGDPGTSVSVTLRKRKRSGQRDPHIVVNLVRRLKSVEMSSEEESARGPTPPPETEDKHYGGKIVPARRSVARHKKIEMVLEKEPIDLEALRSLCWSGAPMDVRARIWKLLLGYTPTVASRREETARRMRQEYAFTAEGVEKNRSEYELHWNQISIDLPRMHLTSPLFRHPRIFATMRRILFTWAVTHTASGYVQGMNDIAAPIVYTFLSEELGAGCLLGEGVDDMTDGDLLNVEADTFHCLSRVLDRVQDNFSPGQPGVQKKVFELKRLMGRVGPRVCDALENAGVDFMMFGMRWMNCLLLREFKIENSLLLLDIHVAEGDDFPSFLIYLAASLLLRLSSHFLTLPEEGIVDYMMNVRTDGWGEEEMGELFGRAYELRTLYSRGSGHLTCV